MRLLRIGLVVGVLVAATACGSDDSTSTETTPSSASPTTSQPATTAPTTTADEPASTTASTPATSAPTPASTTTTTTTIPPVTDVKVYVLRDELLASAHREVEGTATLRGALTELLAGPTSEELAAGLHTEIPAGTDLLDLNLSDGIVTVDLSDDYEAGGGSLSMTARIAQVVFTATQFDNVDQVLFVMNGQTIEFFGGEGIVLDEPVARMNVDRGFTGGIIIDLPVPGDTVTSPFVVTGEGDVYEADFPVVVRRNGVQIAGPVLGFAGAWGEWADFEVTITLDVEPGPIEVVAWDEQGCTPGDPECSPVIESVVPLVLAE